MNQLMTNALARVIAAATSSASKVLLLIERSFIRGCFKNASKPSRTDFRETGIYKKKAANVSHQGDHSEIHYAAVLQMILPHLFEREMFITHHFLRPGFSLRPINSNLHGIYFSDFRAVKFSRPLNQLLLQSETSEAVQQNVMVPTVSDSKLRKMSEKLAYQVLPVLYSYPAYNFALKQKDIQKSTENLEDIDRDGFYDDFYNIDDTENEVEEVFAKNYDNDQKADLNDTKLPRSDSTQNTQSIQPSVKCNAEDIGFSTFVNFARIIDTENDPKIHSIEEDLDVFIEEVGLGRAEFLLYKSHPSSKSLQCM